MRSLLRVLLALPIVAAGAAAGAALGHWLQPDRYVFEGTLTLPPSDAGAGLAAAKRTHVAALRAAIPAATATLNARGIRMSAAEFNNRLTLTDVPESRAISVRCTGREFDAPLAMTNALIVPYCQSAAGLQCMPAGGTLRTNVAYERAGLVLGGAAAAAGLTLVLRRIRRPLAVSRRD